MSSIKLVGPRSVRAVAPIRTWCQTPSPSNKALYHDPLRFERIPKKPKGPIKSSLKELLSTLEDKSHRANRTIFAEPSEGARCSSGLSFSTTGEELQPIIRIQSRTGRLRCLGKLSSLAANPPNTPTLLLIFSAPNPIFLVCS